MCGGGVLPKSLGGCLNPWGVPKSLWVPKSHIHKELCISIATTSKQLQYYNYIKVT